MVAQSDAGRGSVTERADQGSDASQTGSLCACDFRGVLRRPSGRADRPLRDRSSGGPATHDKAMASLIILVCVTPERYPGPCVKRAS
jgi:hypothetical protein